MKSKLSITLLIALFAGIFIYSCDKDTFSELDAYKAQTDYEKLRDSLRRVGGVIDYSVNVIDGSISSFGLKSGNSSQGMAGAVVFVSQHGVVQTDTTEGNGIAVFNDLRIGTMNVTITRPGYTSVDYVVEIQPLSSGTALDNYGVLRQVANMVPIFSLTQNLSTVSGIATIESSLVNAGPEAAANVVIKGVIDVSNSSFTHYIRQDITNPEHEGRIVEIAYQSVISVDTTSSTGAFSMQVPSSPNGLPIKFVISEFAITQQLLMNTVYNQPVFGVQSIRTLFSTALTAATVSPIPTVSPAYVVIAPPTGTGNPQPSVEATAQAVITESGIASISINNPGEGYTQAPVLIISKGTGYNSVAATAAATVTNGKVTAVTINSAGTGYKPNDVPTITVTDGIDVTATAEPKMTYSIKEINIVSGGSGYSSVPAVSIQAPTGTGATATAVMSGYVDQIEISNTGSGYTQTPQVVLAGGGGTGATAVAVMSQYNPLHSIELVNFTQLYPSTPTPTVTITGIGGGSGATATVTLSTAGSVASITLTNAGLGYTNAPTITITGGGGYGAAAYATLNGDGSINIILLANGQGYTSSPNVSITAAPSGGTTASATAQLGFPVESITLNNSGSGYSNKPALNIGGVNVPNANYNVLFSRQVTGITITNNGTNYTTAPGVVFIPVDGNGSGAAATATVRYLVKSVQITNPGSGYVNNVVVIIAPPSNGSQATATAVLGNGVLGGITLTNGGQGYTAPPVAKLIQNGGVVPEAEARISVTVANGRVTGLTIASAGAGYDPSATYSIQISTKILAATFSATVNPNSGQIEFVRITNPGAGYVIAPVVEFEVPNGVGSGSGAAATAVITDGRVSAITIDDPGIGYYVAPTVKLVVPSHNLTAVGYCNVTAEGYINSVSLVGAGLTRGQGYVEIPDVTFYPSVPGMGEGATGIAIVQNGQVIDIKMTNKGQGYLGKNRPTTAKPFSVIPDGADYTILTVAGKAYIRDIYLGTGKRTIEE